MECRHDVWGDFFALDLAPSFFSPFSLISFQAEMVFVWRNAPHKLDFILFSHNPPLNSLDNRNFCSHCLIQPFSAIMEQHKHKPSLICQDVCMSYNTTIKLTIHICISLKVFHPHLIFLNFCSQNGGSIDFDCPTTIQTLNANRSVTLKHFSFLQVQLKACFILFPLYFISPAFL